MNVYKDDFEKTVITFFILFGIIFNVMFGPASIVVFIVSGLCLIVKSNFYLMYVKCYWQIYLIPILAFLSFIWSEYPIESLKGGIQLMLTTIIAMYVAINIPFNIFKNTLWILLFASMICSLLSSNYAIDGLTGEVNLIGVFGSKNYLAFHSSLSFILGFFFLFNKGSKDKLLGILLSMTSMLVVLKANSVGTVGFLCLSILLSSSFIFYQMIRLDKSVKVFIDVILVVLSVFLGSVFIYLFIHGSLDDMIYNMGKDPTLTGRTFLWDIGYYLFLEKPILGYGYEGFFRIGNDGAEDIWEIFHITSRSGFNFHNMYIDTMVEFGSIGLILFVAQLCFFIGLIIRFRYFKFGSKYHFVLLFFTFLFLQTFLESGWSNQFTLCQFFVVYFWVVLRDMEFHSYEE